MTETPAPSPETRMPFFEADGTGYRPTPRATGPWDPQTIGGGPLAALLVHELERFRGDDDYALLRVTVDLLRPAPARPFTVRAVPLREGRRLRVIEAVVESEGTAVCRAAAVFSLPSPSTPAHLPEPALPSPPLPDELTPLPRRGPPSYVTSMQVRPVRYPTTETLGILWLSFPHELLPAISLNPRTRAALTADAVSGFAFMTSDGVAAVNSDFSLYLSREPVGEWLCVEIARRVMRRGIAVASAFLRDTEGFLGECTVGAIGVDRPVRVSPPKQ